MNDKYKSIINLKYTKSKKYPHMSIYERSAQFQPFSALTGYSEMIEEAGRLTDKKIELDNDLKLIINDKLNIIQNKIKENLEVEITYFKQDEKKQGGKYITLKEKIRRIDSVNKVIILKNKSKILITDIININFTDKSKNDL